MSVRFEASVIGNSCEEVFLEETKPVRCDVCLTGPVQCFNATRFLRFASCSSVPLRGYGWRLGV
jgi:hypothetical protein